MHNQFTLRDGVSFCRFGDCAIVLDVDADRYWRVDRTVADALETIRSNCGTGCDLTLLGRLAACGLIAVGDGSDYQTTVGMAVTASAVELSDQAASPRLTMVPGVAWSLLFARRAVRRQPLKNVLEAVRQRRARGVAHCPIDNLTAEATVFRNTRRLMPLAPRCLPDSLALLAFLARSGHFPNLVFGVKAEPFAAHCWVQQGDLVLNDALDHAAAFKPILIV